MLRKSLKIGGGVLLALAILLPDLSLPAAAFPLPQTQIAPVAGPGLDNGVVLVDHRRSHRRYYRQRGRSWNHGYYGNPGFYLNFGVPYGYSGGYDDDYDDYYAYSGGYSNSHVRWCLNRYRSYNPRTDTFLGYDGYRRRCRSPY